MAQLWRGHSVPADVISPSFLKTPSLFAERSQPSYVLIDFIRTFVSVCADETPPADLYRMRIAAIIFSWTSMGFTLATISLPIPSWCS